MGNIARQIDYDEMEKARDAKARDKFKRKPYQAAVMLREQGRQMEEKYDIGKGVDAGGQVNPD